MLVLTYVTLVINVVFLAVVTVGWITEGRVGSKVNTWKFALISIPYVVSAMFSGMTILGFK